MYDIESRDGVWVVSRRSVNEEGKRRCILVNLVGRGSLLEGDLYKLAVSMDNEAVSHW